MSRLYDTKPPKGGVVFCPDIYVWEILIVMQIFPLYQRLRIQRTLLDRQAEQLRSESE